MGWARNRANIMVAYKQEIKRLTVENAALKTKVEKFTSTNTPSTKTCANCQHDGDTYGICFNCCRKCFSDWMPRKTSCVG
jgi:hypothetical protein